MNFIQELTLRGYLYQCTNLDALKQLTNSKSIAAYIGFDCTAESLHAGSMMQIMILRMLQKYGHKPIIVLGGATTQIGDPTGRDTMRPMLSNQQIEKNAMGIRRSLSYFLRLGDRFDEALMLNNGDWLCKTGYLEFLRECGKHISVNHMLTLDSIKNRLERQESLTFTEFNYPILQAYDFYKLYQDYDCVLQIGGSDQWGNIVMGIELCRKLLGKELYGLTTPLLSTSSGKKMGKSEGGAIWLNADMLSPYEFFQYWRNAEDADIERFATLYTEWDSSELDGFKELAVSDVNAAKKKLALRITSICHGEDEATKAFEISRKVFEDRGLDHNMPSFEVAYDAIALKNMHIYDLLTASNLATSKSEARRLIRGNGVRIEDITVKDENQILEPEMFKNQSLKLSVGKKKHILIKYLKKAEI